MVVTAKSAYGFFSRNWQLLGALLLSASLQLSFISKSSIWHDEGYSALLIQSNWLELIGRTARDVHPPLYYLVMKAWSVVFGTSELALRSLSTVCILGLIVVLYLLVRRLFDVQTASLAAWFLALAPFLVRYGQEVRMYALVALLLAAATYALVSALQDKQSRRLWLYAVLMALAFYSHYYAIFMVPAHWLYVLVNNDTFKIWGRSWLGINLTIVALFAPWLPVVYSQFTRVQGGFWIPPVNLETLPNTVQQFVVYEHILGWSLSGVILGLLIGLAVAAIIFNVRQRPALTLFFSYAAVAPLAVFGLSLLSRPIYVDRYFVFVSGAFYCLAAILLYLRPLSNLPKLRPFLIAAVIGFFILGITNVYQQSSHAMRPIGQVVSQQFRPGDRLVAGELYVYLDFSYYNQTPVPLNLYAPDGVSGYGETSLLYDRPELLVSDYSLLNTAQRVWVIGKPGQQPYFAAIPRGWRLEMVYASPTSVARLYRP